MHITALLLVLFASIGFVSAAVGDVIVSVAIPGDAKASLLHALSVDNKLRYCAHWGIRCQIEEWGEENDSNRVVLGAAPTAGTTATAKVRKLTGLLHALQADRTVGQEEGAYVLALDLDAVITSPEEDLFASARAHAQAQAQTQAQTQTQASAPQAASLMLTRDLQQGKGQATAGYQSGVIFAQHNTHAVFLLREVLQHMREAGQDGLSDQKALNAVLASLCPAPTSASASASASADVAAARTTCMAQHVAELPKAQFNAFPTMDSTETTRDMWGLMQLPWGDEVRETEKEKEKEKKKVCVWCAAGVYLAILFILISSYVCCLLG